MRQRPPMASLQATFYVSRFTFHELLEYDAGTRRLHLKNLNGVVHALGWVVEDESGIGYVGVEQLVLSTAEIDVAVIDRAVLVDVVIERQLRLAERLSLYQNVIRRHAHVYYSAAHYNKVDHRRKPVAFGGQMSPIQ